MIQSAVFHMINAQWLRYYSSFTSRPNSTDDIDPGW